MVALGPENRAPERVPVYPEEFFSGVLAKIAAGKPGLFVVEGEGVLLSTGSESSEHAVGLLTTGPGHRASVDAASPGAVAQALISVFTSAVVAVKSIEHHFEKSGEGRFPPAVFGEQDTQAVLKILVDVAEGAEMPYVAGHTLHKQILLKGVSER